MRIAGKLSIAILYYHVLPFAMYFCTIMEQTAWFESWFGSPYYSILYQNRDYTEAQQFIETLLNYLQPPVGSRMVDIACGEGRHAIQLAEHGYDVTGIDLSQHSIEVAQAHEKENLHFMVQDMRFPFYINYFDYAFNFFTSFGYFAHNRDHLMAAKSFAAGVKKGGTLVIDYFNSGHVCQIMKSEDTIQRGEYSFTVRKRLENNHIIKDISFIDANNTPRHYTESVAAFSLEDFQGLFEKAGMQLTTTFGDYKLNPYDPLSSPRMIMIFKK